MSKPGSAPTCIGFLTAVTHRQLGAFGGYLLLNLNGRPLEFHCTAPLKPNRAQEILYGSTLQAYLYGELIGQTLVEKASLQPAVVFTDRTAMLALRPSIACPLVCLHKSATTVLPSESDLDETEEVVKSAAGFHLGNLQVITHGSFAQDEQSIQTALGETAGNFDFAEPFTRIREAIKEAQQSSRPAVAAARPAEV